MKKGYKIRCPNVRRGNGGEYCKCTVLVLDTVLHDVEILTRCSACKAQLNIRFGSNGECSIIIPAEKYVVEAENYPTISQGKYTKKGNE